MAQKAVPPPLYSNDHVQASIEMRAGFARLVQDQKDIIGLFETIATELKTQQEDSRMQPLIDEWDALRKVSSIGFLLVLEVNGKLIFRTLLWQRHKDAYNKSRHNAARCAQFLTSKLIVV